MEIRLLLLILHEWLMATLKPTARFASRRKKSAISPLTADFALDRIPGVKCPGKSYLEGLCRYATVFLRSSITKWSAPGRHWNACRKERAIGRHIRNR